MTWHDWRHLVRRLRNWRGIFCARARPWCRPLVQNISRLGAIYRVASASAEENLFKLIRGCPAQAVEGTTAVSWRIPAGQDRAGQLLVHHRASEPAG
jgi:hypothetical protein